MTLIVSHIYFKITQTNINDRSYLSTFYFTSFFSHKTHTHIHAFMYAQYECDFKFEFFCCVFACVTRSHDSCAFK